MPRAGERFHGGEEGGVNVDEAFADESEPPLHRFGVGVTAEKMPKPRRPNFNVQDSI